MGRLKSTRIDAKRLAGRTTRAKVIESSGNLNTDQCCEAGWIVRGLGRV
jgi:hypothetical protein